MDKSSDDSCWHCAGRHRGPCEKLQNKIEKEINSRIKSRPVNVHHDGHTFIKTGDSMVHHPDCPCGMGK